MRLMLALLLCFAVPAGADARSWLERIFAQVVGNRLSLQGTGQQNLTTAVIRFREAPDAEVFAQLLDVFVPTPFQLNQIGFSEGLTPGSKYYVIEIARPFYTRAWNVMSPGTSVRLLREDERGRLFWRATTDVEYEVMVIEARRGSVAEFLVTNDGSEALTHDQVLAAWAREPAARPTYFGGGPRAECEKEVAPVTGSVAKRGMLRRLFTSGR